MADDEMPTVALAFKLEDGQYGQLTYIRIYQGKIRKGDELYNTRTRRKFRVGRLIRMHADTMEDLSEAGCGEIAALFGIDCASGDTFSRSEAQLFDELDVRAEAGHLPGGSPVDKKASDNMAKALNRFTKEDPTFRTFVDPESNQTIIQEWVNCTLKYMWSG